MIRGNSKFFYNFINKIVHSSFFSNRKKLIEKKLFSQRINQAKLEKEKEEKENFIGLMKVLNDLITITNNSIKIFSDSIKNKENILKTILYDIFEDQIEEKKMVLECLQYIFKCSNVEIMKTLNNNNIINLIVGSLEPENDFICFKLKIQLLILFLENIYVSNETNEFKINVAKNIKNSLLKSTINNPKINTSEFQNLLAEIGEEINKIIILERINYNNNNEIIDLDIMRGEDNINALDSSDIIINNEVENIDEKELKKIKVSIYNHEYYEKRKKIKAEEREQKRKKKEENKDKEQNDKHNKKGEKNKKKNNGKKI